MKRAIVMPRKYIQGEGVLGEISNYVKLLGDNPLVLWGSNSKRETEELISKSFEAANMEWSEMHFPGESTKELGVEVAKQAKARNSGLLVGVGGGKAIDTAKGAADMAKLPIIIVPTIASTDASITSTAGWYNEEGIMTEINVSPFNPDILLVDTGVIIQSPKRLFIAGMGDAVTTWIEADASYRAKCSFSNRTGAASTMAARTVAKLCYDTILKHGREALVDHEEKRITPVYEDVVETLVLHSGLGGESGGIAAAHSIANNLPWFKECKESYHGEMVAFGVVVQLMLESYLSKDETSRITDFIIDVGLPSTLSDLGIKDVSKKRLDEFCSVCLESNVSFFEAIPVKVTKETLLNAIIAADEFGKKRKAVLR